jgi:hypothetical protein
MTEKEKTETSQARCRSSTRACSREESISRDLQRHNFEAPWPIGLRQPWMNSQVDCLTLRPLLNNQCYVLMLEPTPTEKIYAKKKSSCAVVTCHRSPILDFGGCAR